MTIITDGPDRRAWQALGKALPRPKAILVISAHWETQGKTHLTAGPSPRTIHDFGGFPAELYAIQYPAPGSAALIDRVAELLGEDQILRDESWGFDHGAWGVVLPMFPDADIPMVEMSLNRSLSPDQNIELGRKLAVLRDEGILLIGSGNIVHNLANWRNSIGTSLAWAEDFRARSNAAILSHDLDALTNFASDDRAATLAVNSAEHYLPLLYALGAKLPDDETALFNDYADGSISMTSVLIGDAALLDGIA